MICLDGVIWGEREVSLIGYLFEDWDCNEIKGLGVVWFKVIFFEIFVNISNGSCGNWKK